MPIGVLLRRRQLTIILLLLASLSSLSILTVPSVFPPEANHPYTSLPPVTKLDRLYQRWSITHRLRGGDRSVQLPLRWSRAYSSETTGGEGSVTLDLVEGRASIRVTKFPEDLVPRAWLVENVAGEGRSAQPELGDRFEDLGLLSFDGEEWITRFDLGGDFFTDFEVDQVVITREDEIPDRRGLLFGSPSLFQRMYTRERKGQWRFAARVATAELNLLSPTYAQVAFPTSEELIVQGAQLFIEETFDGNGRTCATCHPPEHNFTLDPDFIANLPPDDPLFVHEFVPALANNLEDATLLRERAVIIANVDGFDDLANKFTLRSVSHTLGLPVSMVGLGGVGERLGWGGDAGTLRDFANEAITQHAPLTLNRVPGVDFRLATEAELDALEAFQLFLGREEDPDTAAMLFTESRALQGREIYNRVESENGTLPTGKCVVCHADGGALRKPPFILPPANVNSNTGTHHLTPQFPPDAGFGIDLSTDPTVVGFGDGTFNIPSLIEAADTPPYFHNNATVSLEGAVGFYATPEFRQSPSNSSSQIGTFDENGFGVLISPIDSFSISAFLRVLNALENLRSAAESISFARVRVGELGFEGWIDLALAELDDARGVLLVPQNLHPIAQGLIADAGTTVQTARNSPGVATTLLGDALCTLELAREVMVSNAAGDCDGDGVLDGCEIAQGDATDCDGSGVPDSCELQQGILGDCDGDGIPDPCDIDEVFPTLLDVPQDQEVFTVGEACTAVVEWVPPTAIDNCGTPEFLSSLEPGSSFPIGVTLVVFLAIDVQGNIASHTMVVTVIDGESPIVSVNDPIPPVAPPGPCSVTVSVPPPSVTDCTETVVINNFTGTSDASAEYPVGETVVTWTVTDEAGNLTEVTQSIVVAPPPGGGCAGVTDFVLGDCGGDGSVGLADAIQILNFLFGAGIDPPCMNGCDVDQEGTVSLGDVVQILACLFTTCTVDVTNLCETASPAALPCDTSSCP